MWEVLELHKKSLWWHLCSISHQKVTINQLTTESDFRQKGKGIALSTVGILNESLRMGVCLLAVLWLWILQMEYSEREGFGTSMN